MKEDYPLFVHWYKTLDWVLSTMEHYPKNARFSIASHISDMTLKIMEHIVDAIYTKNRIHILDSINLYIEKLRILFRLSHDRRYISTKQFNHISNLLVEAGRMVGGWRKQSHEKNRQSV
jgi:hypothetical protein